LSDIHKSHRQGALCCIRVVPQFKQKFLRQDGLAGCETTACSLCPTSKRGKSWHS